RATSQMIRFILLSFQQLEYRRSTLLFDPRKDSRMKRIIWLVALMLSPEVPLLAQGLPNGVARSVDTFTGDTVWETKYGRLDDTHGCIREALAIIWKLVRGPSGRTEWLTLSTGDIPVPRAMINVDGRIIEGHEEQLLSGPKNAHLT